MQNYLRHLYYGLVIVLLGITGLNAQAAVSPLGVGLFPGVQFPPEEYTVTGARISILFGKERDLYGIDLGVLGNITEQTFTGVGISGVFNITEGNTTILGLQLAGIMNINTTKTWVYGVQTALIANDNVGESTVVGLQLAAIANLSAFTKVYGLQVGLYNRAQDVYGFQIGLVNVAKSLHGVQIGLVNFNETGTFYVSPILNIGF